jgi:hypothetical protein
MNQPTGDEFKYKYSGGFATYPQQHIPIAIYSKKANKTFFVYGGRPKDRNTLLHMVSYYDHATGTVPRPAILLDKKTTDAHDNPTLSIDDDGYLWVFSNAHGTGRPAFIHRSEKPYSIDAFERVVTTNFSYSQPWHLSGAGFLFLHTRYKNGRSLFWQTSRDGRAWDDPRPLARFGEGHYQVSWPAGGNRVGTAFDYHPSPGGLNARTNLYYVETPDAGRTWATAAGTPVTTPLAAVKNPALVRDYQAEGLLVYLKDLQFDAGRPVVLYLTSRGHAPGPTNGPRTWHTARWTGSTWDGRDVTTSDHNYDHGSLYVEADGWRMVGTTDPGPQPDMTGGEVVEWVSPDRGVTWRRGRTLTHDSVRNHTYVRRPLNAHPDFAALWADGDPRAESESRLYLANRAGDVYRLPAVMTGESARPERVR